jgi:hypothetical protein
MYHRNLYGEGKYVNLYGVNDEPIWPMSTCILSMLNMFIRQNV